MEDSLKWTFPNNIRFEDVSEYDKKFKGFNAGDTMIFDLRKTVNIHSSFIGFLIHAKHHIDKNNGKLILLVSLTVERILIMLNIIDFLGPHVTTSLDRKTA